MSSFLPYHVSHPYLPPHLSHLIYHLIIFLIYLISSNPSYLILSLGHTFVLDRGGSSINDLFSNYPPPPLSYNYMNRCIRSDHSRKCNDKVPMLSPMAAYIACYNAHINGTRSTCALLLFHRATTRSRFHPRYSTYGRCRYQSVMMIIMIMTLMMMLMLTYAWICRTNWSSAVACAEQR